MQSSFLFFIEVILSVLFLGYIAARKKNIFASQIKERRLGCFALAGATKGAAGCLLDVEFRRNSTSGGVNHTRNIGNIHTPPCFSEKSDAKTFIGATVW